MQLPNLSDLNPNMIPDIFRSDLLHFQYEIASDKENQKIYLIFSPSMFPFIKLRLPFDRLIFSEFIKNCETARDRFAETEVDIPTASSVHARQMEVLGNGSEPDSPDSDM